MQRRDPSNSHDGKSLSLEDDLQVRFWVNALLKDEQKGIAAEELHSIGVRTRGAVRVRGSANTAAPSRFPPGTPVSDILKLLQAKSTPEVRASVVASIAEWGGVETLAMLSLLVSGADRDTDTRVRAAAVDALGMIGGPEAITILEEISTSDPDTTLQSMARSLIHSLTTTQP